MKIIKEKHAFAMRWTHWVNFPILAVMMWSAWAMFSTTAPIPPESDIA